MTPSDCLLLEEIEALLDGRAPDELEARAEAHLDTCADCRALYYEVSTGSDEGPQVSEHDVDAIEARVRVRARAHLAATTGVVIRFRQPAWTGTKLAADTGREAHHQNEREPSFTVHRNDDVEILAREVSLPGAPSHGTVVAIEVNLSPTVPFSFVNESDVEVSDSRGAIRPLESRIRPLVWLGTFSGEGLFHVRVAKLDLTARLRVERP
jgi:hypothetical protein